MRAASAWRELGAVVLGAGLLGCGGTATPTPSASSECSIVGQNAFVRDTMRDWYYWYDKMPTADPAAFGSPAEYLEVVRYRVRDTTYSYVTSKASSDAYYSDSQFIGMGISFQRAGPSDVRVAQVFPESPASEVGLVRGDFVLSINGRSVSDLLATGGIGQVLGPEQLGVVLDLAWRTLAGEARQGRVTKRIVTIPTVSYTTLFAVGTRRVAPRPT